MIPELTAFLSTVYHHIRTDLVSNLHREDVFGGSIPFLPILLYPSEFDAPFLATIEKSGIQQISMYAAVGLSILDILYAIGRFIIALSAVGLFFIVAVLSLERVCVPMFQRWTGMLSLL